VANQDFTGGSEFLQHVGFVRGLPDDGEIDEIGRADVANDGFAGRNADAKA